VDGLGRHDPIAGRDTKVSYKCYNLAMTHRRGFTLIELVIVIAIIGILASLAIPKFIDMSMESKRGATKAGLGALRALLATRYAASATGGATASYPTFISATDFGSGQPPVNKVNPSDGGMGITALTGTTTGTATPAAGIGFWYVSLSSSADYGKAGAYSDGIENTSSY
jgi:prepilin-type N-terminal cleavage/methylation domain-containing protein